MSKLRTSCTVPVCVTSPSRSTCERNSSPSPRHEVSASSKDTPVPPALKRTGVEATTSNGCAAACAPTKAKPGELRVLSTNTRSNRSKAPRIQSPAMRRVLSRSSRACAEPRSRGMSRRGGPTSIGASLERCDRPTADSDVQQPVAYWPRVACVVVQLKEQDVLGLRPLTSASPSTPQAGGAHINAENAAARCALE